MLRNIQYITGLDNHMKKICCAVCDSLPSLVSVDEHTGWSPQLSQHLLLHVRSNLHSCSPSCGMAVRDMNNWGKQNFPSKHQWSPEIQQCTHFMYMILWTSPDSHHNIWCISIWSHMDTLVLLYEPAWFPVGQHNWSVATSYIINIVTLLCPPANG